jgi:hypothetical protein
VGGSGGGGRCHPTATTLDDLLRGADQVADRQVYDAEVNRLLNHALAEFNDRDVDGDRDRLAGILDALDALDAEEDEAIVLRFGGSVRKHTFVDGLSDVDVLAIVNEDRLGDRSPQDVLAVFAARLRNRLSGVEVEAGTLAITVRYPDRREIQVLPALSTSTGVRIASVDGDGWSRVVRPAVFARKLTEVNQALGNRVVPAIKLFKGIAAALPGTTKLTGYHAESLAIEAFTGYDGPLTPKAMVHHLFRSSAERVLRPIRDRTGQSLHVDDRLGKQGSYARRQLSARLDRIAKRIEAADRRGDVDAWHAMLGEEE